MSPQTRQITLSRRRQSAYGRLSESQKLFFINSAISDIDNSTNMDIDGDDMEFHDNRIVAPMNSLDSEAYLGGMQTNDCGLSGDEHNITSNIEHQNSLSIPPMNGNSFRVLVPEPQHKRLSRRTFSDMSEQFVENIDHIVQNPPISHLNKARKHIGKTVNDNRVQGFILALIVINAIMMGIATFPVVKDSPNVSSKFELIDQIFLIIFTIEAAMQLAFHGWTLFKDAFLVFDLTIVALSWALEGVKVARAFRIFRALRLITRIDVMRNLIKALISVIPNLTGIAMLLFLVFYIFAVMFTQLFKDASKQYPRTQQYFVALPETFFTLFQMMTLDGWKQVFLQAYEEYWWSWILFVAFIVVTAFVFANLIIAVICDAVHVLDNNDVAGLIGYEEDEVKKEREALYMRSFDMSPRLRTPTIQRLREMEVHLNQIVLIKDDLSMAVNFLVNELVKERHQDDASSANTGPVKTAHEGDPYQSTDQKQSEVKTDVSKCDDCEIQHDKINNKKTENGNHHSIFNLSLQDESGTNDTTSDLSQFNTNQRRSSKGSFSDMSARFAEGIDYIVENPPISHLNKARKQIGKTVNDERIQGFISALIVINAIMMGIATFPVVKDSPNVSSKFELIDQIFLIIFTIEAVMQLTFHGWTLFKDAFLVFDLTIVALSWALEGVKVARAFRIFRALRLITRIDVMRNLITALISVIPNLTGIVMLLFLVFYIFAVMFTQLYKDVSTQYPRTQQYFVALPETFFTLFQMMTLDGWKQVFLQAHEEYWWSWILFVAFIVVTAFIFFNLIIAVVCDAVHVMGDGGVAGLTGCDEDKIAQQCSKDPLQSSPRSAGPTDSSLGQKLRELERGIDEIVSLQNELTKALDRVAHSTLVHSTNYRDA